MEKGPNLREAVLRISREHFAPKVETRNHFDQLLEEIRQMRLGSEGKWEEDKIKQWQENKRRWGDQERKWKENQQVIR